MLGGRKQNLDTYWHVRRKYQNTKPMVSKNHSREDNLRPAGYKRSRKWEHVREITRASDGKVLYALCDGGEGDPVFWSPDVPAFERPSVLDTINLSPIVWEIEEQPDGSFMEIVKVRNGSGSHAHHVRYQFLEAFLPEGLKFTLYGGKQFVVANDGLANEKRYYLPKSQTIDGCHWDNIYDQVDRRENHLFPEVTHAAYIKKRYGYVQKDDHKYLKFARTTTIYEFDPERFMTNEFVSSDWELISPEFKLVHNSTKVDKARKNKLKPYIEGFWDWTLAVGNTLPIDAKGYIGECKNTLRAEKVITSGRFASTNNFDGAKVENILKDPHHELRVQLLAAFMASPKARESVRRSDKKAFRAAYNTWINKTCGLVTIIKGEE